MTMRLSMLLTADGKQAKAEIKGLADETKKLGTSTHSIGKSFSSSKNDLGLLADTVQLSKLKMSGYRAEALRASIAQAKLGTTSKIAAGGVGNLTAQFNDIGVMLAAGQNPLQLALQQGTQITQVIGPLGAAGAVKALGSAFLGMINPVSLATIGIIAGGAALFQWATRADEAEENADTFAESLKGVKEQASSAKEAVDVFLAGAANREVLALSNRISTLLNEAARLRAQAEKTRGRGSEAKAGVDLTRAAALEAEAQALRDQLAARQENVAQEERLVQLQESVPAFIRDGLSGLIESAQARVSLNSEAQSYLNSLQQEVALQSMIQQFGEDSAAVTALRAQQERAVVVEAINARDISKQWKEEMIRVYDTVAAISAVNLANGINPAVSAAEQLAKKLGIALSIAKAIAQVGGSAGASGPDEARQQVQDGFNVGTVGQNGVLSIQTFTGANNRRGAGRRSGGGGGGGGGRAAEANAAADLTKRLQQELDVLRETDPVQKELIRNRETLATASEEERAKVEELISARISEADAIEQLRETTEFWQSAGETALDSWIVKGEKLDDVLKNLALSIIDAAIQAQLFGSGPFGGGTSLLDLAFPALTGSAKSSSRANVAQIAAASPANINAAATGSKARATKNASTADSARMLHVTFDYTGLSDDRDQIREATKEGMREVLDDFSRNELPVRFREIKENPRMVG